MHIYVCVYIYNYIYIYIHVVSGVYQPKYMSAGHHRVFLFRGMSSLWNSYAELKEFGYLGI